VAVAAANAVAGAPSAAVFDGQEKTAVDDAPVTSDTGTACDAVRAKNSIVRGVG